MQLRRRSWRLPGAAIAGVISGGYELGAAAAEVLQREAVCAAKTLPDSELAAPLLHSRGVRIPAVSGAARNLTHPINTE